MNQRLENLRNKVRNREYKKYHLQAAPNFVEEFDKEKLTWTQRMARLAVRMCQLQKVVIEPDERIVFTQTVPPDSTIYTDEEFTELTEDRTLHEGVAITTNVCPDWEMVLSQGMAGRREAALAAREKLADDKDAVGFLDCAVETIDALLGLTVRYAEKARQLGRNDIAQMLENVPENTPRTFHEALQFLRLAYAVPWFVGHYQIGLGRFDQYMWPYLKDDLDSGTVTAEEAEELLAEFFIALNKDTDLFPGAQPGDNGQTIALGGVKKDGSCAVNELTKMVLRVTYDVALIDPKINLRISADTDLDLLSLATRLTSKGLGFPQYLNDDVTIPALVSGGYELEDARDYTVAGCWENIIPGKGLEITNIGAISFPAAADKAIRNGLVAGDDFEGIMQRAANDIQTQADKIFEAYTKLLIGPSPYLSVLMTDCLERGSDACKGLKYNNFGLWGACAANAADSLAAVKRFVFEEQSIKPFDLIDALDADFERFEAVYDKLKNEGPKVGNNDDCVDSIMVRLFDCLADVCQNYGKNNRGGIIKPGVSTAMYYMWLARGFEGMREPVVGATADGRKKGTPFSANLAPSHGAQVAGPLSVLQSFSKINTKRIYNGGPVTMEFSDTVFRGDESVRKVAMFVRTFAKLGIQQMQINTLNREKLIEAKKHPEGHRDLIVRVWGWSGYFCELDPEYQDQVIARHMYSA